MEGRVSGGGGCCIARYGHNHHGPATTTTTYHYNNPYFDGSKIDHIMLRFRPIAPKPIVSDPNKPNTSAYNDSRTTKGKRKATNTSAAGGSKKRKKSHSPSDDHDKTKPSSSSSNGYNKVTLPLLPETPDLSPRAKTTTTTSSSFSSSLSPVAVGPTINTWLRFGSPSSSDQDQTAVDEVVGSSVIIEGVTDTWMEGNSLGTTNEEKRRRLDWDTCPGFISDGWNRVCWTNKAYRKMVGGEGDTCRVEVKLGKREKVELPAVELFPAFTCRVKVQYGKNSMTVPCDACGLHGGGFAWRLDINAALCLGR